MFDMIMPDALFRSFIVHRPFQGKTHPEPCPFQYLGV